MTVQQEIVGSAEIGVRYGDTPRTLSEIHEPGCAAAIWQRQPLPTFQSRIDAIAPGQLPKARLILRAEAVHDALFHRCQSAGMPESPERAILVDDIAALADIFASVMGAEYLRVRLDVIQANESKKFVCDAFTARLICTYRGTGTQYGLSFESSDQDQFFTVPTCAPIVLRGSDWPVHPPVGLRHRSPPIKVADKARFVLVLDPVPDLQGTPENRLVTRH